MKAANIAKAMALISATTLLTACGGGAPDADDIQAMLDKTTEGIMKNADPKAAEMAKGLMPSRTVNEVKNCEEIRDDVYKCDVDSTVKVFGATTTQVMSMTVSRNSEGDWVMTM